MKIIPLDDYVLLEVIKEGETTSRGGIIIPTQAQKSRDLILAKVLAAGPGYTAVYGARVEVSVKPGQEVLLQRGQGDRVGSDDEKELRMVRCCEIRAIVEESRIITASEPGKIVTR